MIIFTERCEDALQRSSLRGLVREMEDQLESYTGVDIGSGSTEARVLELKLKALILDTIHNIDVVQILMANNTNNSNDWTWQKQLRYVTPLSSHVSYSMKKTS